MGAKNPPIPRVIHHFYTLGRLENWGYLSLAIEIYGSLASQKYEGQAYTSDITKRWKNTCPDNLTKSPLMLSKSEAKRVIEAAQKSSSDRDRHDLLVENDMIDAGFFLERNEEKRLPSPRTSLAIAAAHRRLATPLPVTAAVAESTHLFLSSLMQCILLMKLALLVVNKFLPVPLFKAFLKDARKAVASILEDPNTAGRAGQR
ncbi:hypothetical protein Q3G72_018883 [Acer saccharum]|nr:hypothetical protein Q3G72_018883 [Acer saccharum]